MTATSELAADDRGILISCPRCHRANRVPFARLHQRGQCGSCKGPLSHVALPVEIDSGTGLSALIRSASLPVLVDFWAPWCGPCRMAAPEVEKLAALAAGELLVVKVNTEAQPGIGASMDIRSIPTFAVFVSGREVERTSGAMSASQLCAFALRAAKRSEGAW